MIEKIKQIMSLPKVKIEIINDKNSNQILELYKSFVKFHPKYKIIRNKTLGVMLYKLPKDVEIYEKQISGKNSVAYFSRRCTKKGYYTTYINPNDCLQELYEINTSSEIRQGEKMTAHYFEKMEKQEKSDVVDWIGVYSSQNILVRLYYIIKDA